MFWGGKKRNKTSVFSFIFLANKKLQKLIVEKFSPGNWKRREEFFLRNEKKLGDLTYFLQFIIKVLLNLEL